MPWSGRFGDYRKVDGLLVPHQVGANCAHFGHREHPDRSIMNAQIGAS
jgi:hypothetical protein